jgi:hypothetical protein
VNFLATSEVFGDSLYTAFPALATQVQQPPYGGKDQHGYCAEVSH